MEKIKQNNWKDFIYTDIFNPEPMPLKLSNKDIKSDGDVPVQSSKSTNNGIIGYTDKKAQYIVNENKPFYVVFGDHTRSFSIVDYSFNIMDNVKVLSPKKYDKDFILFVITVWQKNIPNLGYSRHWSIAKNAKISLPIKNSQIDYQYIKKYIKNKVTKINKKIKYVNFYYNNKKEKMNVTNWKNFTIKELFDIHPTKAYKMTNASLLNSSGKTPVVVNSAFNNGIGGYSLKKATEKGNIITFSDTVDANTIFYQEYEFIGYPHVQGMYPIGKYKDKWNKYSLLFFCSVFRATALRKSFDYDNKFRRDIAIELKVKLPVNKNNEPDWKHMENYMKRLIANTSKKVKSYNQFNS